MFKCKSCSEKNLRIEDLKEQIHFLRLQLNPPPRLSKYEIEEDYMLNGGNEEQTSPAPIDDEANKTNQEQLAAIQLEHDQIMSGSTWES